MALHVFIAKSNDILKVMEHTGLSSHNVGSKIISQKQKMLFLEIKDHIFLDMKTNAMLIEKLRSQEREIIIHTSSLSQEEKILVANMIFKYCYTFSKYKSKERSAKISMNDIDVDTWKQIEATNMNRDLQNEPANVIYPETFVTYAKKILGKHKNLRVKVLDEKALKAQHFNLILEMGKSSIHKPRFMIVEYKPTKPNVKKICLVGKGVTFDSGGINLKPTSPEFFEMKADKAGAATVIAVIKYAMMTNLPVHIIGLIPLIENAISGNTVYPGNIIRSYSGKTIEIVNTDAEGRLILVDAFGYIEKNIAKVDYIMDLATLTGSAEAIHCDTSAIFFTMNKDLAKIITQVGEMVGERVHALPQWPEYMSLTKSEVADFKNVDFKECTKSGAFMATMFLMNFIPKNLRNKWIHFDITHSFTGALANGNGTLLLINIIHNII